MFYTISPKFFKVKEVCFLKKIFLFLHLILTFILNFCVKCGKQPEKRPGGYNAKRNTHVSKRLFCTFCIFLLRKNNCLSHSYTPVLSYYSFGYIINRVTVCPRPSLVFFLLQKPVTCTQCVIWLLLPLYRPCTQCDLVTFATVQTLTCTQCDLVTFATAQTLYLGLCIVRHQCGSIKKWSHIVLF